MEKVMAWLAGCLHRFALTCLILTILGGLSFAADEDNQPPKVCEGSLLYRSPYSGRYESAPLIHTHVALDVRGLVVPAPVTQQHANPGTHPIEAEYNLPLPHDAAVYDME